ncbi:MAG: response regulator, partial [Bdellovibrionia bacterium]
METQNDLMLCKCILIIEDEETIRDSLQFFLEFEGYQVYSASNGREGLDILSKLDLPCLILLDLMMPVMDG